MSEWKLTDDKQRFSHTCKCHHPTILLCPVHEYDEWSDSMQTVVMDYWLKRMKPALDPATAVKWADEYDLIIIKKGIDAANRFVCKRAGLGMETTTIHVVNYANKVMKSETASWIDDTLGIDDTLISMPCSAMVN
jgi:hypothetical protein